MSSNYLKTSTYWKKLSLIIVKPLVQVMYAHKLRQSQKTFCGGSLKSQIGSSVTPRVFPGYVTSNRPFFCLKHAHCWTCIIIYIFLLIIYAIAMNDTTLKSSKQFKQKKITVLAIQLSILCVVLFKFSAHTFNEHLCVDNAQWRISRVM